MDGGSCSCAPTLLETGGQHFWSPGIPSADPKDGADVMRYARIFMNNSTGPASVIIQDTAGNGTPVAVTNVGVDSVPPQITVSPPSANKITIQAIDPVDG